MIWKGGRNRSSSTKHTHTLAPQGAVVDHDDGAVREGEKEAVEVAMVVAVAGGVVDEKSCRSRKYQKPIAVIAHTYTKREYFLLRISCRFLLFG